MSIRGVAVADGVAYVFIDTVNPSPKRSVGRFGKAGLVIGEDGAKALLDLLAAIHLTAVEPNDVAIICEQAAYPAASCTFQASRSA